MDKKEQHHIKGNDGNSSPAQSDISRASTASQSSLGTESDLPTCRVCHCIESDKRGDAVLGFLGITPPVQALQDKVDVNSPNPKKAWHEKDDNAEGVLAVGSKCDLESGRIEFISPEGEVFVCKAADLEVSLSHHQDALMELGCSCKSDLALVHYACALKWFISHGSTACEICGRVASNVRSSDFRKVLASLKEYEALRERTASGLPTTPQEEHDESSGVDPDALAAIRRQRLSEISLWFNPHNNNSNSNSNFHMSNSENRDDHLDEQQQARLEPIVVEQQHSTLENVLQSENRATKWAVEGTGILLATGLLTVTLAWLLAPHVGKRTAKNGLHILLGGVCALAVVIFFRFFVLTRIRYGPARYWAILFVFWFLVFGIWASRTHGSHSA